MCYLIGKITTSMLKPNQRPFSLFKKKTMLFSLSFIKGRPNYCFQSFFVDFLISFLEVENNYNQYGKKFYDSVFHTLSLEPERIHSNHRDEYFSYRDL